MSKLTCHIPMKPITPIIIGIVLVLGILVSSICATSEGEGFGEGFGEWFAKGFAIYLTKQDIPPAQMEDLSHVDIAERPIITISESSRMTLRNTS